MAKLEKEFDWYLANQDKLVKKYNGRHLVIIGEEVVGDYESHSEAYFRSEEKYELGTFLIQECTEGVEAYTVKFRSANVRFS
jgi:hypothetical protein